MPKLKTNKGVAKRFRVTRTGKVVRRHGGKSHLMTGKKRKRVRSLRRATVVAERGDRRAIRRLLPYG